jgi:N-acetylmuramoyl-L-alanine amidase
MLKNRISLLFFLLSGQLNAIELQKVFHHRIATDQSHELAHIDLAKIILYFDVEPTVKVQEQETGKKNSKETIFFIPQAKLTAESKQMITALNNGSYKQYGIKILPTVNPIPGLHVRIEYDPRKIILVQDSFDAITKAKSFEIRLVNKTLIDALQKKNQSVLRTSLSKKPTVIIDCGHGGSDSGALGLHNTIEKDITLSLGKLVGKELTAQGFRVVFTRTTDQFIALDERTYKANQMSDDSILISLHANKCSKEEVHGLETFCLASNLFTKKTTGLETAIDVMIQAHDDWRYQHSKRLAQCVHRQILKSATEKGFDLPDRKVRHAATQMLLGIKWPGILIETDYLSNTHAAQQLKNPEFQKILAHAICQGIKDCF